MPFWARVGHRLGRRRGYVIAAGFYIIGLLSALAAPVLPLGLSLLFLSLASVGYAGIQLFPLALLPDAIDEDAQRTGAQKSASFTGVWTAAETVAFAIGPALVLIVLALTGYASSTGGSVITQSEFAITGVRLTFSLLPAILVALSIPVVLRFPPRDRATR
jgi:GPH family glycoside/pentoside/hexuronide:cation symporter